MGLFEPIQKVVAVLSEQNLSVSAVWGGVTNPAKHDPSNYRYLVHAINPMAAVTVPKTTIEPLQSKLPEDPEQRGNQSIDLCQTPEKVADRVSLSLSMIDPCHTGTWGYAGLILEVPKDNVLITSPDDVGSIGGDVAQLKRQAINRGSVIDGDTLLHCSGFRYNEVVALATRNNNPVRLVGFFYKVTEEGQPFNDALTRRMHLHASRLGLPIVPIVEKSFHQGDRILSDQDRMVVLIKGVSYAFKINGEFVFSLMDQRLQSHFMSPKEMDRAVVFLREQGTSESEIQEWIIAYQKADRQRQIPKVCFDKEGNILSVSQLTGYGDEEWRRGLSAYGYSSWINLKEERESFSTLDISTTNTFRQKPISPYEASRMIERLFSEGNLSEEQKLRVQAWFDSIRSVIQQIWDSHSCFATDRSWNLLK